MLLQRKTKLEKYKWFSLKTLDRFSGCWGSLFQLSFFLLGNTWGKDSQPFSSTNWSAVGGLLIQEWMQGMQQINKPASRHPNITGEHFLFHCAHLMHKQAVLSLLWSRGPDCTYHLLILFSLFLLRKKHFTEKMTIYLNISYSLCYIFWHASRVNRKLRPCFLIVEGRGSHMCPWAKKIPSNEK